MCPKYEKNSKNSEKFEKISLLQILNLQKLFERKFWKNTHQQYHEVSRAASESERAEIAPKHYCEEEPHHWNIKVHKEEHL